MHSLHEYFSQIDTRFGCFGCIISVVFTIWQCLCLNLISEKNVRFIYAKDYTLHWYFNHNTISFDWINLDVKQSVFVGLGVWSLNIHGEFIQLRESRRIYGNVWIKVNVIPVHNNRDGSFFFLVDAERLCNFLTMTQSNGNNLHVRKAILWWGSFINLQCFAAFQWQNKIKTHFRS